MFRYGLVVAVVAAVVSGVAHADAMRLVKDRQDFMSVIKNRSLTIPLYGIDLRVRPDGKITGKGAGRDVRGDWRWSGAFFCRDLYWGERDLGPNCQEVRVEGDRIRFTSDKGAGRTAVFRMR